MHSALNQEDIIVHIAQFLDRRELARLSRTSKAINAVTSKELWATHASIYGLLLQLPCISATTRPYSLVRDVHLTP